MFALKTTRLCLIDHGTELCTAWRHHLKQFDYSQWHMNLPEHVEITSHPSTKIEHFTPPRNKEGYVTGVVSPGNALGEMNGGIDRVYKEMFGSRVESALKGLLVRGYAPPGSVRIVYIPGTRAKDVWDAEYLLHMPTMRYPRGVHFSDEESLKMVFDWMWSILSAVEEHNKSRTAPKIGNLLVPGLATGYGKVPANVAATAMIGAIVIFYYEGLTDVHRGALALKFLGEDVSWIPGIPDQLKEMDYNAFQNGIPSLFFHTKS